MGPKVGGRRSVDNTAADNQDVRSKPGRGWPLPTRAHGWLDRWIRHVRRKLGKSVGRSPAVGIAIAVVMVAGASVVGASTVGTGGDPFAAQVGDGEHRIEITNDGSAQTSYEASFDDISGTEGFGPGDEVSGNDASGFVRGGTDTIIYTGDVTDFSFTGPTPTVRIDGSPVDPDDLGSQPAESEEHEMEITNDGSGQSDYSVTFGQIVGTDGFGPGDVVDENSATGFVNGGTDTIHYTGNVSEFTYTGVAPTVRIDGTTVPVSDLGADSNTGGEEDSTDSTGQESDGNSTTEENTSDSTGSACLANPFEFANEDQYSREEYRLGMPDRFAEDILETDGVGALYYGYEGQQAGVAWLAVGESGAEPMIYCKANSPDTEGIILSDWRYNDTYTDAHGDREFTPSLARWTVDPTYQRNMSIADQSVEWLLEQDHVQRVEKTTTCDRGGCEQAVTVYLTSHPLAEEQWWQELPDRIDGVDVTYAEA